MTDGIFQNQHLEGFDPDIFRISPKRAVMRHNYLDNDTLRCILPQNFDLNEGNKPINACGNSNVECDSNFQIPKIPTIDFSDISQNRSKDLGESQDHSKGSGKIHTLEIIDFHNASVPSTTCTSDLVNHLNRIRVGLEQKLNSVRAEYQMGLSEFAMASLDRRRCFRLSRMIPDGAVSLCSNQSPTESVKNMQKPDSKGAEVPDAANKLTPETIRPLGKFPAKEDADIPNLLENLHPNDESCPLKPNLDAPSSTYDDTGFDALSSGGGPNVPEAVNAVRMEHMNMARVRVKSAVNVRVMRNKGYNLNKGLIENLKKNKSNKSPNGAMKTEKPILAGKHSEDIDAEIQLTKAFSDPPVVGNNEVSAYDGISARDEKPTHIDTNNGETQEVEEPPELFKNGKLGRSLTHFSSAKDTKIKGISGYTLEYLSELSKVNEKCALLKESGLKTLEMSSETIHEGSDPQSGKGNESRMFTPWFRNPLVEKIRKKKPAKYETYKAFFGTYNKGGNHKSQQDRDIEFHIKEQATYRPDLEDCNRRGFMDPFLEYEQIKQKKVLNDTDWARYGRPILKNKKITIPTIQGDT